MIRLRLFTLPNCPNCPEAKELANTLQKQRDDLTVEVVDMSDPDNYATALMLQIAVTPSFAIEDTPIYTGRLPTLEELNEKIDEYKSRSTPRP